MLNFFRRLKVSQKLTLISVFFMIPDGVLLCLFLLSINSNIRFAQWEQYGNAYQRPLEGLLEELHVHRLLADASGQSARRERAEAETRIEAHFQALMAIDAQLGATLQFTPEGLAKRKREHCRVETLKEEWERLKAGPPEPAEFAAGHLHLIADVRTMITHVGDSSNLILDPDLDSYYLMDVTLLALPQMQDRLGTIMAYGANALRRRNVPAAERRQLAVHAALLKEADLARVVNSTQTALNEDQNFYGASDSLQRRLPAALEEFNQAAQQFIELTVHLSEAEQPALTPAQFLAAG